MARELRGGALADFAARLREARVPPLGELYGACLVAFLSQKQQNEVRVSHDVRWVMETPEVRGLLLPALRTQDTKASSEHLQAWSVATLLACRVKGLVDEASFDPVEMHLLSGASTFGDPRIGESPGWRRVRERSPAAYQDFLQKLIREDLRFFFQHAMKETARARFWLNYLRSIRRTVCWMDRTSAGVLERQRGALPADLRAAFARRRELPSGEVSAFCLYFDQHVVVEFSEKGNAAYVYERSRFEKDMVGGKRRIWSAADLKEKLGKNAWRHGEGWERHFYDRLWDYGIRPDSRLPNL